MAGALLAAAACLQRSDGAYPGVFAWASVAIAAVPTPLDPIVQETGLSAGEVSGALLQLELLGLVAQLPGMRYERR